MVIAFGGVLDAPSNGLVNLKTGRRGRRLLQIVTLRRNNYFGKVGKGLPALCLSGFLQTPPTTPTVLVIW